MRSVLFNNDTIKFVSVLLATATATIDVQFIGLHTQRYSTDLFVNLQFMHSLTTGALQYAVNLRSFNSYTYCLYSVLTLIPFSLCSKLELWISVACDAAC